ncbi:MAG: 2-oxoglutarate dehydrogenase complex dihydrolipoyllysine-residue succinyltransferase [Chlamydiales bacterium]|nr:2-oxoglutarate dehydrogenase complex dihydrolipoyllysine-residue succinyltransferase [Chlamydiales bacterium]NCF71124.1 2-oxoglutarate dehydrogenase complex dihydrolipoyllysine-residue succinyltransferase [Chlamydiales bacterium]
MKVEIKVPSMGESVTEATVSEIIKASGSFVGMDEEVLELETDKVNQVLYAPQAGVVTLEVGVDDTVTIGQVIGYVDTSKQQEESHSAPKDAGSAVETKLEESKVVSPAKAAPAPASSQQNARMMKKDFAQEVQKPKASSQTSSTANGERPVERKKMSKIRKVIASRLVEAKNSTAMLTTFNEVDLTDIIALRKQVQDKFVQKYGVKLGFMSLFVKAVVKALQEVPQVNAYIDGEEMVLLQYFDIGIAVGTDRGLMVPVIKDCDKKNFAEVETTLKDYAEKARSGRISLDLLQGGGFTITNGGVYGSLVSTPILNTPQSGILGMHAIQKRPVVKDNEIAIRDMMYLALSYDHRVIDGKEAVTFLVVIKEFLEAVDNIDLGI